VAETGVPDQERGLEKLGWLLIAALCAMWATFLFPSWRRHPRNTVKDFERNMDLLADTEGTGRWIVTPRKGMTFVGPKARAQARARERRRRILVVLIESIGLTGLIGLVPPLRAMWYATGVLLVLLGMYVWLLLTMKHRAAAPAAPPTEVAPTAGARPARVRYAADAAGRTARAAYNGLATLGEDPGVIVVRSNTAGVAGV
jgi:hypothetical protein